MPVIPVWRVGLAICLSLPQVNGDGDWEYDEIALERVSPDHTEIGQICVILFVVTAHTVVLVLALHFTYVPT